MYPSVTLMKHYAKWSSWSHFLPLSAVHLLLTDTPVPSFLLRYRSLWWSCHTVNVKQCEIETCRLSTPTADEWNIQTPLPSTAFDICNSSLCLKEGRFLVHSHRHTFFRHVIKMDYKCSSYITKEVAYSLLVYCFINYVPGLSAALSIYLDKFFVVLTNWG